ncbi:M20 metallopeptidase family protein [Thermodesulfatator autotrophicus]|uniref:Peptidase M20 n=1 Tax=Thermodesulfatator autotrophicus TaxID=1795632 RepID=A0A177E5C8_9BACT|nr:M20 family metallopeptidase [Thermodesulfatator autotrophicus]OAG26978.1 peptidase M20 [Thermodesulfatator autotrophicus]
MFPEDDKEFFKWLIKIRRNIHEWPELAYEEHRTAALIAEELSRLDIPYRTGVAKTGIVAELGHEGPCVALRADMDALPLQEETGLPFASKIPGVMHACGHDGHVAMLLGAAHLLKANPPSGRVRFIFQPAEEKGAGALEMIKAGALKGVSAIFSGHIDRHFKVGEIAINEGLICAFTDTFTINIEGKGGHAAWPHEAIDAVVVGSLLVVNIQTIISREVNPAYPCVITVGKFEGGTAHNVIAERAYLEGTIRSTHPEVRKRIIDGLKRIAKGVGDLHRAHIKLKIKEGYPPVINTPEEAEIAREAARLIVGKEGVLKQPHPSLGGEDFAFYLKKVPGCFVRFGAVKKGFEKAPAHSPKFDFDERALPVGAKFLAQVARLALKKLREKEDS